MKTRAQTWGIDITLFALLRGLIELLINIPNIALGASGVLISKGILTVVVMFTALRVLPALTNGRTPGKTALGIRMVTLDNQQLTMSRLCIRNGLGYTAVGRAGFSMGCTERNAPDLARSGGEYNCGEGMSCVFV